MVTSTSEREEEASFTVGCLSQYALTPLFSGSPLPLAKNEGDGGAGDFPRLRAWGTDELKNTTLTPLTYIRVDAHDGVHIFRVIARLDAMNCRGGSLHFDSCKRG